MDSFQVATLEVPVERAVDHVEEALRRQGFDLVRRMALHEASGATDIDLEPFVLLHVLDSDRAMRVLEQEREAGLLLSATVVVREYGDSSMVQVLDPPLLSLGATDQLRPLGDELADALRSAFDHLGDMTGGDAESSEDGNAGDGGDGDASGGGGGESSAPGADEVEQQLLHAISDQLAGGDVTGRELLDLAKAYTAIASLRRTEEVELHLA